MVELYGHSFRRRLLGTNKDIFSLRSIRLPEPVTKSEVEEEIIRDLRRTYPTEKFFSHHFDKIKNVLLWYSWTNKCRGYCQCFSFIAFALYRVYFLNDPNHCMIDTYYSLHKIVLVINPLLPRDANDSSPLQFTESLKATVLLDVMQHDHVLFEKLKNTNVLFYLITRGFSTLYLNWFTLDEGIELLNFLIVKNSTHMFHRLIHFLVAFLLVNKEYFIHFDEERALLMLNETHLYNFNTILWKAKSLI